MHLGWQQLTEVLVKNWKAGRIQGFRPLHRFRPWLVPHGLGIKTPGTPTGQNARSFVLMRDLEVILMEKMMTVRKKIDNTHTPRIVVKSERRSVLTDGCGRDSLLEKVPR
jgi:hypothetical protein